MKYEVQWTTEKVAKRAQIVLDFWLKVKKDAVEKQRALSIAEHEDKTVTGMPAKLRRLVDTAEGQRWRAAIMLQEANDSLASVVAGDGGAHGFWKFTNEDLLWFYPELADGVVDLLQLKA